MTDDQPYFGPGNATNQNFVSIIGSCSLGGKAQGLVNVHDMLEKDFDAQTPLVAADPSQIRQVMMNLIINAVEATPEGERVGLSLKPAEEGGAVFSIRDTGGGVHPPDGKDIFDPFVTTRTDGAGLGLHICRRIIEAHGGKIGYRNTEDGAEFHFTLPAGTKGD